MQFFRLEHTTNRVFGLDVLRFIAIFMVLIGHSLILVPMEYKPAVHKILLDGVAIFFVLSGYLIGGILIRQLQKEAPSIKGLVHFWSRRWMRTVPAYLFVLLVLLAYTAIALPDNFPPDWWKFFFFIQNFESVPPSFFAESWSLSIEEWFYLLVPTFLFGSLYVFRSKLLPTIVVLSVVLIALISWYRYYIYHKYNFHSADPSHLPAFKQYIDDHITYQVIPRLDAIMFGVIGAFLANYFPNLWKHKFNILLLILGCWLLYYTKRNMGPKYGEYSAVWFPLIKSLVVLMMLPFLSNWKNGFGRVTKFITFFSLISYSMYLVNLNVVTNMLIKNIMHGNYDGIKIEQITPAERRLNNIVYITETDETGEKTGDYYTVQPNGKYIPMTMTIEQAQEKHFDFKKYRPGKHIVGEKWWLDYTLFWALVIGISFTMYKLIEIPFMNLRDRKKKA